MHPTKEFRMPRPRPIQYCIGFKLDPYFHYCRTRRKNSKARATRSEKPTFPCHCDKSVRISRTTTKRPVSIGIISIGFERKCSSSSTVPLARSRGHNFRRCCIISARTNPLSTMPLRCWIERPWNLPPENESRTKWSIRSFGSGSTRTSRSKSTSTSHTPSRTIDEATTETENTTEIVRTTAKRDRIEYRTHSTYGTKYKTINKSESRSSLPRTTKSWRGQHTSNRKRTMYRTERGLPKPYWRKS
mmetsp:Transcript_156/g.301  ORF Transcript_156/g.301 Transcript_156/m.301 type:complete len:245 (-) Transcript_156:3439-4173(-)